MSTKVIDPHVRVINEEYERVLSNPDNVIVSEDLQELLELNLSESEESEEVSEPESQVDTASLTILDSDHLPLTVRGELCELSFLDDEYTFTLECQKVRPEFLTALDKKCRKSDEDSAIIIGGIYDLELDCAISCWTIRKSAPYRYQVTIKFRSDDVIF